MYMRWLGLGINQCKHVIAEVGALIVRYLASFEKLSPWSTFLKFFSVMAYNGGWNTC